MQPVVKIVSLDCKDILRRTFTGACDTRNHRL